MNKILEGLRIGADIGDVRRPSELSPEAAQSLARRGQVAYRVVVGPAAATAPPPSRPGSGGESRVRFDGARGCARPS